MEALIIIIVVLVAVVAYCAGVYWVVVHISPEILFWAVLVGIIGVAVLYGLVLLRSYATVRPAALKLDPDDDPSAFDGWFARTGVRALAWIPVVVLLLLIFVEIDVVVAGQLARYLPIHSARAILPELHSLLRWVGDTVSEAVAYVAGPGNARGWSLYIFGPKAGWLHLLGGTAAKSVLLFPFLLLARGTVSRIKSSKQAAFKQYFYQQAFLDLRETAVLAVLGLKTAVVAVAGRLWKITAGMQGFFVWPITLTLAVALLLPAAVAVCVLALLLALHGLALGVTLLLCGYLALMLFCMERAVILVRRGYAKCPHAGCHEPVPLPVYLCPKCRARHSRLLPGEAGLLFRRCECGDARLPTLFLLGKGKLPSLCPAPKCGKPLQEELFVGSAHVPIYGGPSSGKTLFMMTAAWQLLEGQVPGLKAQLIDAAARKHYELSCKPKLSSGRTLLKTSDLIPDAFLMSLRRRHGLPISLYLYDPAGESMESDAHMGGHRYLRHLDGLALLVDPLSVEPFKERYQTAGHPDLSASTSHLEPREAVERVVAALQRFAGLTRTEGFTQRVAVILSKADVPSLEQELGIRLCDGPPEGPWAQTGAAQSAAIRRWLRTNDPALAQLLETRFGHLRFFATSSLGHLPERSGRFEPKQVLAPLFWLLSGRLSLTRPLGARILGRLAEVSAALAVVGLFLGLPALAASRPWGATAQSYYHGRTEGPSSPRRPERVLVARPTPSPPVAAPAPRPATNSDEVLASFPAPVGVLFDCLGARPGVRAAVVATDLKLCLASAFGLEEPAKQIALVRDKKRGLETYRVRSLDPCTFRHAELPDRVAALSTHPGEARVAAVHDGHRLVAFTFQAAEPLQSDSNICDVGAQHARWARQVELKGRRLGPGLYEYDGVPYRIESQEHRSPRGGGRRGFVGIFFRPPSEWAALRSVDLDPRRATRWGEDIRTTRRGPGVLRKHAAEAVDALGCSFQLRQPWDLLGRPLDEVVGTCECFPEVLHSARWPKANAHCKKARLRILGIGYPPVITDVFFQIKDKKSRIQKAVSRSLGRATSYRDEGQSWRAPKQVVRMRPTRWWLNLSLVDRKVYDAYCLMVPSACLFTQVR